MSTEEQAEGVHVVNAPFTVFDAGGNIIRSGSCPENEVVHQAGAGETVIVGHSDPAADRVDVMSGAIVRGEKPTRADQPPMQRPLGLSAEQQLDLLWQAMDAGTFPKAEPFYSALKAAKVEAGR